MTEISHVVAMAKNRVIGDDNQIPWDLPEDRKYFKKLTTGHIVLMGRKTLVSIGKALPKRTNIVLSRHSNFPDCLTFPDLDSAIFYCQNKLPDQKIFIIGGGQIYQQTLPLISKIYLTLIDKNFPGDVLYPEIPDGFRKVSEDIRVSPIPHSYIVLERNNPPG